MPAFEQAKYCPNCKKNVSADKNDRCKVCGEKIERGAWSTRFRIIENGIEKQKRLSGFKTKREANDAYVEFITTYKQTPAKKNISFLELYNEYENFLRSRTKSSTHYDFKSKTEGHILPYFKDYIVEKITPKDILNWQQSLDKYSYNYKCHLRNCLSSMLRYADKYHNIPNQLPKVDGFRNLEAKKEMSIWTPDQFQSVMEHIDDIIYKTFFYALYYTGCRKGEMLATTWNDWDLKNNTLNINKSVSKKVTGASWMLTTPKNASSIRKIRVPEFLCSIIKSLHEWAKENKISGDFVFIGEKPLPETSICRILKNAAKAAEIPEIRIHDFRHSHASLLISEGASIVAVAKRLGHSNIEQTLNTYAHMMPNEEDTIIKILSKKTDK